MSDVVLSPALAQAAAMSVRYGRADERRYGVIVQGRYRQRSGFAPVPGLRKLVDLGLVAEVRAGHYGAVSRDKWAVIRPTSVKLNEAGIALAEKLYAERLEREAVL